MKNKQLLGHLAAMFTIFYGDPPLSLPKYY